MTESKAENDNYIPLLERFRMWWHGVDAEGGEHSVEAEATGNTHIEVDDQEENIEWSEERIRFCRRLWGQYSPTLEDYEEIIRPGGIGITGTLSNTMGLDSTKSFLDLSAGLGGGLRKLTKDFSLWSNGMEPDPELANAGMHLSTIHGMAKTAPIVHYDVNSLSLEANKFHGILAHQIFHRISHKEPAFQTIYDSLKERGHLVFVDFILPNKATMDDPLLQAFLKRYHHDVHFLHAKDYRDKIHGLGLDVRTFKDYSASYKTQILTGWANFVADLKKSDLDRDFVNNMMREAEYWLLLTRCLDAKKLGIVHCHAIKPAAMI